MAVIFDKGEYLKRANLAVPEKGSIADQYFNCGDDYGFDRGYDAARERYMVVNSHTSGKDD